MAAASAQTIRTSASAPRLHRNASLDERQEHLIFASILSYFEEHPDDMDKVVSVIEARKKGDVPKISLTLIDW
jgi:hypothetical protein